MISPDSFQPWSHEKIPWDEDFEQRPESAARIEYGVLRVMHWIEDHARSRVLDRNVLESWHRAIFGSVFPRAAGMLRGSNPHVAFEITIGDAAMGTTFSRVPEEMDVCCAQLRATLQSADSVITGAVTNNQFDGILQFACWIHAEIVRIHPFCDGNGRTARLALRYIARRYGLRAPPVISPEIYSSEYRAAMRAYLRPPNKITGLTEFFRPLFAIE